MRPKTKLVLYTIRGGEVSRMHTVPHIGEYSVASHSYGVVSLILALHPQPSVALIQTALWHDAPEHYTGDVPAHAKWDFPEIAEAMDHAESAIEEEFNCIPLNELRPADIEWLKACDGFELWLWCRSQLRLGNTRARIVMERIEARFHQKWATIPVPVQEVYTDLRREDGDYGKETDDDRYLNKA